MVLWDVLVVIGDIMAHVNPTVSEVLYDKPIKLVILPVDGLDKDLWNYKDVFFGLAPNIHTEGCPDKQAPCDFKDLFPVWDCGNLPEVFSWHNPTDGGSFSTIQHIEGLNTRIICTQTKGQGVMLGLHI